EEVIVVGVGAGVLEEAVLAAQGLAGRPPALFPHERVGDRLAYEAAGARPARRQGHVPTRAEELRRGVADPVLLVRVAFEEEELERPPGPEEVELAQARAFES